MVFLAPEASFQPKICFPKLMPLSSWCSCPVVPHTPLQQFNIVHKVRSPDPCCSLRYTGGPQLNSSSKKRSIWPWGCLSFLAPSFSFILPQLNLISGGNPGALSLDGRNLSRKYNSHPPSLLPFVEKGRDAGLSMTFVWAPNLSYSGATYTCPSAYESIACKQVFAFLFIKQGILWRKQTEGILWLLEELKYG